MALTMKSPAMRIHCRCLRLFAIGAALTACGGRAAVDHGPAPASDHQAAVRAVMDRVLDEKYRLDGSPEYRFAAPVQDRVARWLFDGETASRSQALGFACGWCVDFWVKPRYVGYPEQPESHRMAFFAGGQLRGIFSDGPGNAPLQLDRWIATWVDAQWRPAAPDRP